MGSSVTCCYGGCSTAGMAVRKLAGETGDASMISDFGVAQKFHANYYHDFIEDYDYDDDRAVVKDFISRVLTLVD